MKITTIVCPCGEDFTVHHGDQDTIGSKYIEAWNWRRDGDKWKCWKCSGLPLSQNHLDAFDLAEAEERGELRDPPQPPESINEILDAIGGGQDPDDLEGLGPDMGPEEDPDGFFGRGPVFP